MKLRMPDLRRRNVLLASIVGGFAWLAGSFAKPAAARQKASLISKHVDRVPDGPDDNLWQGADMLEVPMAPQAVVKPRTYDAAIKAIKVRGLYDDERIALLLEWEDPKRAVTIGGVASFRDAVAVEFPAEPVDGIPYFGMGEPNKPVTIYQWKADWEFARNRDVDEEFPNMAVDWYPFSGRGPGEIPDLSDYSKEGAEKVFHTSWWSGSPLGDPELQAQTSVEKLLAEGFGTIRSVDPNQQDAYGTGTWKNGVWKVVMSFPRAQEQFTFERGKTIPVAFAAWDGAHHERGGEKAVSTWYFLSLEQPIGAFPYIAPVVVVIGAALIEIAGLRKLRDKRTATDHKGSQKITS
ncbi:MAG: ethylbenzene dehydrogenase-related protein [Candidatus Methylomirabilales bacterium]